MNSRMFTLLLVGTLFRTLPCSADLDAELSKVIESLKSGESVRVAEAKTAIEKVRPRLVRACLEILDDHDIGRIQDQWATKQSVRNVAIELLGKLRSEESVDLLIENLSPPSGIAKTSWPFKGYPPAIEALARIGKTAVTKLLDRIAVLDDQDALRGVGLALIQIEGFDGGRELLDNRIRSETDVKRRERFTTARDLYIRLPKTLPQPGYDE